MGYGDEIMATGLARGARARGRRIAFGNGRRIIFGPWSEEVFRHNPNIAWPGDEGASDLEWIAHYKGRRLYNRPGGKGWIWNTGFRATPGELFFDAAETAAAAEVAPGFILVEPHVPSHKSVAPNKDWGFDRYQEVAALLLAEGYRVAQFNGTCRTLLKGVEPIPTSGFRAALAILAKARLYIGPEGGLHHGAAAVGVAGVVLFGGFIPPSVTGYAIHTNLTGGAEACGSTTACEHCRDALDAISVDEVYRAAKERLA